MRYTIKATVNYPDDEADTPDAECDLAGLTAWVYALANSEPDATSFLITIVPQRSITKT